ASINHALVKQGWCWYRKYAPGDTVLEGLEKNAGESKKGLWADSSPISPWEWRKREPRARYRRTENCRSTQVEGEKCEIYLERSRKIFTKFSPQLLGISLFI